VLHDRACVKNGFVSRLECVAVECFLGVAVISNNLVSRLDSAGFSVTVRRWLLRAEDVLSVFLFSVWFRFQNMGLGGL
jgi:hypothetical protein